MFLSCSCVLLLFAVAIVMFLCFCCVLVFETAYVLLRYARKHFTGNPVVPELPIKDIQMAMGLLAFSPSTKCRRYQVYCNMSYIVTSQVHIRPHSTL